MTDPRSGTPSETPTKARAATDEDLSRKCHGCGRRIYLDAEPDAQGTYWWRLEGGNVKHDEVACVRAHGTNSGASTYRTDGRVGRVPKKLPRGGSGVKGSGVRASRKRLRLNVERGDALYAMGVTVPNRRAVHVSEKTCERTYCSVTPTTNPRSFERWV